MENGLHELCQEEAAVFEDECELPSTSSGSSDDEDNNCAENCLSDTDDAETEEEEEFCQRYSSQQLSEIRCTVPVDRMPCIMEGVKEMWDISLVIKLFELLFKKAQVLGNVFCPTECRSF